MKKELLLFYFLSNMICFGQENTMSFKKKSSNQTVTVGLPVGCDLRTKDDSLYSGFIYSKSDSTLLLSYHYLDTLKLKSILSQTEKSRKQRNHEIDSLYLTDSINVTINFKDIKKMSFGVMNIKQARYKVLFWAGAALTVATAG